MSLETSPFEAYPSDLNHAASNNHLNNEEEEQEITPEMIDWLRKNIYIYFEEIENLDEEVELSVVIPRVYKSL